MDHINHGAPYSHSRSRDWQNVRFGHIVSGSSDNENFHERQDLSGRSCCPIPPVSSRFIRLVRYESSKSPRRKLLFVPIYTNERSFVSSPQTPHVANIYPHGAGRLHGRRECSPRTYVIAHNLTLILYIISRNLLSFFNRRLIPCRISVACQLVIIMTI